MEGLHGGEEVAQLQQVLQEQLVQKSALGI